MVNAEFAESEYQQEKSRSKKNKVKLPKNVEDVVLPDFLQGKKIHVVREA